jgi:hypothetical protein
MISQITNQRFDLGTLLITNTVSAVFGKRKYGTRFICSCLTRHANCDWGSVSDPDENLQALKTGGRLLSVYNLSDLTIWIITEADRSATTVLFPEDY